MNYYNWLDKNFPSLKNKTVAVSGATGGIGTALCNYLAYLGANIICLDRNADKSYHLINSLKFKYPYLQAKHLTLNLENIAQVKSVAEQLKNLNIDYLVLNAGAYKISRHKCDTGYDNVFQINFISPYFLACELAPFIKQRQGRIVAVSSIAHNYSHIDTSDIDFSGYKASSKVYGNAKRFLTIALYELFNGNNTLSVTHPGITLTGITSHYPKPIFAILKYPMKVIFMSPKKASLCILIGLFDNTDKNEWIGPRFFNIWGLPKKQTINTCSDTEAQQISEITHEIFNSINKQKTSV